ncbi:MAG: metallophosphoesterase [Bdellovibrionales bacterium]|nr:metallophosphoesterase [Bdellovibrionales bacterium]
MITEIRTEKLLVISDLHLGNPFSQAKRPTVEFFRWASANGFDVAINGDGFEIAQTSFTKLARDVPEVLHAIKTFTSGGRNLYYVIGNHDIALENFLNDWGGFKLAPFLNVKSGEKRIRVEHGHLYDPAFVNHPRLYEFLTAAGGILLNVYPGFYKLWMKFERFKSRYLWGRKTLQATDNSPFIPGEHPAFREAAIELTNRGFDAVIFGHTHHSGMIRLDNGAMYYNTGSWLARTPMVAIESGAVEIRHFRKT